MEALAQSAVHPGSNTQDAMDDDGEYQYEDEGEYEGEYEGEEEEAGQGGLQEEQLFGKVGGEGEEGGVGHTTAGATSGDDDDEDGDYFATGLDVDHLLQVCVWGGSGVCWGVWGGSGVCWGVWGGGGGDDGERGGVGDGCVECGKCADRWSWTSQVKSSGSCW